MELTHFGHSCLLAEFGVASGAARLLFDPGTFSHGFEGVTGLSAILITHQHPDHADPQRLPALVEANPQEALQIRCAHIHPFDQKRCERSSVSTRKSVSVISVSRP